MEGRNREVRWIRRLPTNAEIQLAKEEEVDSLEDEVEGRLPLRSSSSSFSGSSESEDNRSAKSWNVADLGIDWGGIIASRVIE